MRPFLVPCLVAIALAAWPSLAPPARAADAPPTLTAQQAQHELRILESGLTDPVMAARLAATSAHMQARNGPEKAAGLLESLALRGRA